MPEPDPPKKRGRPSKPVDPNTLGGKIRAARVAKGLGLVETATAAEIEHPSLIDIEKGRTKNPARRTLRLLAEKLGSNFGLDWLTPYAAGDGKLRSKKDDETYLLSLYRKMPVQIRPVLVDVAEYLISRMGEGKAIQDLEAKLREEA